MIGHARRPIPTTRKERHVRTYPLDAITKAADDFEAVRSDGYSGRGMYGNTCAAVTFDSMREAFRFFALLGSFATSDDDAAMDPNHPATQRLFALLSTVQTDSMGIGIVAYFPGWTFA